MNFDSVLEKLVPTATVEDEFHLVTAGLIREAYLNAFFTRNFCFRENTK